MKQSEIFKWYKEQIINSKRKVKLMLLDKAEKDERITMRQFDILVNLVYER
jgi:hypothetical protein